VFYYSPSQSNSSSSFTTASDISSSNSSLAYSTDSEIVWTLSDCGVHTITSTTTDTEYFANTTLTSTIYGLTPNQVETNGTIYTEGESTYATYTSYGATTTSTSTSTLTTTHTTTQTFGCAVVHLNISVFYPRAWNGSYSYGSSWTGVSGNASTLISFQGTGSRNISASFQGNLNDGICYMIQVQKDDGSNNVLNVSFNADSFGSYANSTSASFGSVKWGGCVIS